MYRNAHQYLAMGIGAIVAFLSSVHMLTAIFMIPISGFLGILPDYDIKWNIAHRRSTHANLIFLIGIPIVFTFFTAVIEYTIQLVIKTSALTGMVLMTS